MGILIFGVFLLEWEGVSNCEVALLAEAALPRSTALLRSPTNPTHPPTTLAVQATPGFNSNETNKREILRVVIQVIFKINVSHKARPLSVLGVGDFKGKGERSHKTSVATQGWPGGVSCERSEAEQVAPLPP